MIIFLLPCFKFQVSELSLELLLLQVILPALLEQSHTRTWLKALIRGWCRVVAWILDLQSYLLRDQTEETGPAVIEEPQHPDLGAAHQALLQREGPIGFQPYIRPRWFSARLVGLLFCVCVSLVIASLIAMTLPVWLGRRVMALWMVGAPAPSPPVLPPALSGSGKFSLKQRTLNYMHVPAEVYILTLFSRNFFRN